MKTIIVKGHLIKPMTGTKKPGVATGGSGGGRHQHNIVKEDAKTLVAGYVARSPDGHVVVRDLQSTTKDQSSYWDELEIGEVLLSILGLDKEGQVLKVEFDAEAEGTPLFDLVQLDEEFFLAPVADPIEVKVNFELGLVTKAADKRYTFGVVYKATNETADPELDTHDEFALSDDLQEAQWEYVRSGNRNIYLQHGDASNVIGEIVDIVAWPFEVEAEFTYKDKVTKETIPANSVWMGVVWTEEVWPAVKDGSIGGLSMGGWARRLKKS
ncbi:hypothetical protein LCGC14_2254530 [marine sediment metagenome]|uniref:Phage-like element PBSX protein XkdF domain-containing protein n=1 Tax=marine sediment metagenome TaxID=412755 RepID=A0A0F9FE15_9ZZZZ